MREEVSGFDGHDRRVVTIRWIQAVLLGVVVLLVGFRIWGREQGDGSSSVVFGLMAVSALSIGVLERYRAQAAKRSG